MRFNKRSTIVLALVAAIALTTSTCSALSIESEPVKVTNRNSGPRYDIGEDSERVKLIPESEQPPQTPDASNGRPQEEDGAPSSSDQEPTMPLGHVSIRRIFLVPMMRPPRPDWQEAGADGEQPAMAGSRPAPDSDVLGQPSMFAKPFWPFLTPARPAHSHHLFGADEASRSPSSSRPSADQDKAASGAEREEDQAPLRPPMFDPIQMMVNMMHQAINSQLMPPTPDLTDLNKEASSSPKSGSESPDQASEERPQMPGGIQLSGNNKPIKPSSQNETREDIVEIDGKKYLRKTVINRHIGDNIIFMTKRLIFVPLNETEAASNEKPAIPTTTTTTTTTVSSLSADKTEATTTTVSPTLSEDTTSKAAVDLVASSEAPVSDKKSTDSKPAEELATTTTTTTTTTSGPTMAASEPTSTTSPEQAAATSTAVPAVETTTKAKLSWVERVTDVVDKAAERLVEGVRSEPAASTSTEKPNSS